MRSFRHLTRAEITDIVVSHHNGETQADLARRFSVDHSTIHYHLRRYERAYPEEGGVYALVKVDVRRSCIHPSSRCTLCSAMWDQINRGERDEIARLKGRVADLEQHLRLAGIDVECG